MFDMFGFVFCEVEILIVFNWLILIQEAKGAELCFNSFYSVYRFINWFS